MEFMQQEARSHIALSTISSVDQRKGVYQATTMPIGTPDDPKETVLVNGNGHHHIPMSESDATAPSGENGFHFPHISSLPPREPLDIQFKDVSYTVNLGYFKGESKFDRLAFTLNPQCT